MGTAATGGKGTQAQPRPLFHYQAASGGPPLCGNHQAAAHTNYWQWVTCPTCLAKRPGQAQSGR